MWSFRLKCCTAAEETKGVMASTAVCDVGCLRLKADGNSWPSVYFAQVLMKSFLLLN